LTHPVYAGPLDSHYRKISWDDAIDKIVNTLKKTPPDESFFYFSGRSSNEAAFIFQLFARLYGTNNINNCSYFCHQASGVALTSVTGSSAGTVTLEDVDKADLIFVIGANPASNHPRFLRTIVELRRRGGKVIVINPIREPGLVKFKVPSDWRSMLKASRIADEYVQPHVAGDCALFAGLLKVVIERNAMNERFVTQYAEGWDACRAHIESLSWDDIVERCGISRGEIERIAAIYCESKNTIFAWAMGITHHEHGVANVQMLANLALARGMIARPGAGLLPLRGHSNVQGVGSMGVVPNLKDEIRAKLEQAFDVALPNGNGLDTLLRSSARMKAASASRHSWAGICTAQARMRTMSPRRSAGSISSFTSTRRSIPDTLGRVAAKR
jgi:molybdopterin-dependent oxidoreductase alpha subunit